MPSKHRTPRRWIGDSAHTHAPRIERKRGISSRSAGRPPHIHSAPQRSNSHCLGREWGPPPPPGHSSKDAVHSSCTRRSRHAGRHCAHRIHLYPCFKGLRSGSRLGVLWPSRAEQQIEHAMRRRDLEVQQPRRVPAALKLSARFWDCALLGVQQRVRPSLVGGLAHARRGGLIAEAQMQVTRMCDLHAKHCAARSDVISNAYECQETNPGSFRMISFNANLQQAARKDTTIVRHGQADDTRTT